MKENAKVRLCLKVALSKARKRHWTGMRFFTKSAVKMARKAESPNPLTKLVRLVSEFLR